MGLNAKTAAGSAPRTPPLEAGIYPGRLVQVIDLGLQPRSFKGEDKEPAQFVQLTYELADEFLVDEDGEPDPAKPRWVSEDFPLFNLQSEKAKSTARYMTLDPTVAAEGDFAALVGTPVNIHIVQNEGKNGRIYMKVSGLAPMREKEVERCPPLVNEPRILDLDKPDMEVFERLPDWIKNRIKENLEYQGSLLAQMIEAQAEANPPAEPDGESDDSSPY